MRKSSQRYKSKLSRFYKVAKSSQMTLTELIELKRRGTQIDTATRLTAKLGEVIDWQNFSSNGFVITVPILAGNGQTVELLCVCYDFNSFKQLQARYGDCPEDIEERVLQAPKDLEL
ncbi:hypothetical protein [Vibrio parahaemolyticus]|uniref:hypothetical protein n=2 Tax=Vibrio parahaemolyticus TaxID=670 RepID=UPI00046F07B8|nr:hypothetical protein [Vibrio parahaemolyticus]EKP4405016.1 hypothetical protein [Vibrio parahaemolyticus]MDF5093159.1 hypothetical protein [Vibrio parahaemolyticus]MDF5137619.1 hypothetical protein [Vibrio parahaemolyticus]NMU20439.1 hypothetical protein [Vibrio parahaemolyticus]NMU55103.1 hypothetical protein [Vibrio parahaemolyticus]